LFLKKKNRVGLKSAIVGLFLAAGYMSYGQSSNSFTALQQPVFAKIGGLGGVNVSLFERGTGFFQYNPALLPSTNYNRLALGYSFLPGGAGLTNANYNFNIEQVGVFGVGMQYLSYGSIEGYDATGAATTPFTPSDYALVLSHARQANNIRIGASLKFANTAIAGYNGNALMMDIGAVFVHPDKDFTVGVAIQNFGIILSEFSTTSSSTLPFDIQVGTSFKPQYMPIRFSVTGHHLHEWNLMGEEEAIDNLNTAVDNIFRHFVFGAEIILKEQFSVLLGYNQLRRSELRQEDSAGFSGISVGFELNIKAFEFVYALGGYHVSGNNNQFTLAANLSEITSK
jgi:hypothetical protein